MLVILGFSGLTYFPFLVHAIASSFSVPPFSSAVFPTRKLYVEPSPPHCVSPPVNAEAKSIYTLIL